MYQFSQSIDKTYIPPYDIEPYYIQYRKLHECFVTVLFVYFYFSSVISNHIMVKYHLKKHEIYQAIREMIKTEDYESLIYYLSSSWTYQKVLKEEIMNRYAAKYI